MPAQNADKGGVLVQSKSRRGSFASAAISASEGPHDHESQTRLIAARATALHEVVVTGIGVILPNCDRRERLWEQLSAGESQLSIELDPADHQPVAMGIVRDFDSRRYLHEIPERLYSAYHREQLFYVCSVAEAARDAGLSFSDVRADRIGLFDGTSRGSFSYWYDTIQRHAANPDKRFSLRELNLGMPGQAVGVAAALFKIQGPTYTFNGTCAAGAIAIGNAFRELQLGRIDVAFGTGHDAALGTPLYQMYRDAKLVSSEADEPARAIRPYTEHRGNAFGEGAVTLTLETRTFAEARGAEILAEVISYRHGNGGEHPTDVDFTGERPSLLVRECLKEAELETADVGFVVGHGNGVRVSDLSELNYMKRLFGRRTRDVPLLSTKPVYGHTLGASSALNAAAAALMLKHDYVIPTVGLDPEKVVHGFNHQAGVGEAKRLKSGVVVAYGMGGQNATLVLRKERA